jgi:hypothetical protein
MGAIERFWSAVKKTNDCWIWTKSTNDGGYGQFNFDGDIRLVHRLSYEIAFGPIPKSLLVCHKCDNRVCVRPDHLFLGTHTDNNRDMFKKGRGHVFDGTHMRGERNPNSKLTDAQRREVWAARERGETLQSIGDRYGISKQAVRYTVLNKRSPIDVGTKSGTEATVSQQRREGVT